MRLQPPSIDRSKYRGVIPDKAAAYIVEFERLTRALATAEKELAAWMDDRTTKLQQIGQEIADYMQRESSRTAAKGADKLFALQAVGEQLLRRTYPGQRAEAAALHREAATLFSAFDVQAFVAAWAKAHPCNDVGRIANRNSQIAELNLMLSKHRTTAAESFEGPIPRTWEELRADPSEPESVQNLAHAILCRFARDWRSIAPCFGQPCTVGATLIVSMPEPLRTAAANGYELLGLSPGDRPTLLPFDGMTGRPCAFDDPRILPTPGASANRADSWTRRAARAIGF